MATLKTTTINDTGYIQIAAGGVAARPASPTVGMVRYNTDAGYLYTETWNGSAWVELVDNAIPAELTKDTGRAFTVTSFTATGTSTFTVPANITRLHVLVVGGGGSGGHQVGGGGGGGGYVEIPSYPVYPGQVIPLQVGAGGPAPSFQPSNNMAYPGTPSYLGEVIALGGGGGGSHIGPGGGIPTGNGPGGPGGNGGGGGSGPGGNGYGSSTQGSYQQFGAVGYGFPGGNGHPGGPWCGGGGGGAGGRGRNGNSQPTGGTGGNGRASWITGEQRYYAGGGGGCVEPGPQTQQGRGGLGGGGRGSDNTFGKNDISLNGQLNTGGGGGGSRDYPAGGGNGGPGIVIVRY